MKIGNRITPLKAYFFMSDTQVNGFVMMRITTLYQDLYEKLRDLKPYFHENRKFNNK